MQTRVKVMFYLLVFSVVLTHIFVQLSIKGTLSKYSGFQKIIHSVKSIYFTLNKTTEILLKERDDHNTTKITIPSQVKCISSKYADYKYFPSNHNCNHQKIMDYFFNALLELNKNLAGFNRLKDKTDNMALLHNGKTSKIGILIPTTTRGVNCGNLLQFPLFKNCLPSVIETLTVDFFYKIFIGFDVNDVLFAKLYNLTNLNSDLKFISLVKVECQTFVAAVNKIAKAAYEEGIDYFVRINDDTVFITSNWSNLAIDVLRSYDPPDVGVVGPTCKEGNTGILTHDMVHRTHLDIFPYYYPPVFENWFSDTWITRVYQPDHSTKLTTWTVKHLIQRTRYVVERSLKKNLSEELRKGKIELQAYGYLDRLEKSKLC